MGLEGEHGVAPRDHLPVAAVHAVEGADRHPSRAAALGRELVEACDPHRAANTTTGASSGPRGSPMATSSPPLVIRTGPVSPAPGRRAPGAPPPASSAWTGRSGRGRTP